MTYSADVILSGTGRIEESAVTEPNEPQVIIVGAGPGGLCLAGELALAGIRVTVLERRGRRRREARSLGLQARALELLALRCLVAPFLERGNPVDLGFPGCKYPYHVMFADVRLREQPPHGAYMRVTRRGLGIGFDFGDGRWRIGSLERLPLQPPGEVSLDELDAGLRRVFGHSLGPHDPLWTSRARSEERRVGKAGRSR